MVMLLIMCRSLKYCFIATESQIPYQYVKAKHEKYAINHLWYGVTLLEVHEICNTFHTAILLLKHDFTHLTFSATLSNNACSGKYSNLLPLEASVLALYWI